MLRTCGQALYVPWDGTLQLCGLTERLLRFRVTLSVCTRLSNLNPRVLLAT